jgi:hypothetical protein
MNNGMLKKRKGTPPPGFVLVDACAALAVIAMLVWLAGHGASELLVQRRGLQQRAVALQEAANQLEELQAAPGSEVTPEKLAARKLSAEAASLPEGSLEVSLDPATLANGVQKLQAIVRWRAISGETMHVALSAWRTPGATP